MLRTQNPTNMKAYVIQFNYAKYLLDIFEKNSNLVKDAHKRSKSHNILYSEGM